MSESRYYADIKKVQELDKVDDVNRCLTEGWELLKVVEEHYTHTTESGLMNETQIIYVLGQKGVAQVPQPQASNILYGSKPSICKNCAQQITWSKHGDKWSPLNLDGTNHRCMGK